LEKIPLTANGKLDKKALPHPEIKASQDYIAPQNEREKKLVEIWAEMLGIEKDIIGTQDNFFHLGGHSLKAIQLAAMIHKELNARVTLPELFKMPTIKELSRHLEGQGKEKYAFIQAAEKKAYYPVSSEQKRLFILNIIEGKNSINYNVTYVISIKGEFQQRKLEEVFTELIKRHESLRTSFVLLDDRPVQIVHDNLELSIQYIECDEKEAKERVNHFAKPFDLSQGPLIRVQFIKPAENQYILAVDMPHIISDGLSHEILIKEFICLYRGEKLSPLKIQYKDYSQWQVVKSQLGQLKDREQYWLNRFTGDLPVLNLPTDYPRPSSRSLQGKILPFELDNQLTNKIKDLNRETGTTFYMVLLAAFNILLARYSLQEEIIVGTPATGRNHADLKDIIGCFANMLAMKNCPNENKIFVDFLMEVKETALQAYENQDFPFEELVEKLGIKVDPSRNPIFDVVLNVVDLQDQEPKQNKNHEKQNAQMSFEPYEFEHISAKYDLLLRGFAEGDHFLMSLEYSTTLFKESTAKNIIEDYTRILNQVVQNKELKLEDIINLSDHLLLVKKTGKEFDMEFNF
jgi:acyl carrier protein